MKTKAVFFHAGCPVCLDAESAVTRFLDRDRVDLEVVNFADSKARLPEAETAGVKSVPALVLDGRVLHLNFGASLDAVRG